MAKEREPFSEISQSLIGRPYKLGETDCFAVVVQYLKRVGVKCAYEFKEVTLDNYADLFNESPQAAKALMVEYLDAHLKQIEPIKAFCRDIMLLQLRPEFAISESSLCNNSLQVPFLGINGGNGVFISAAPGLGVAVTSMSYYKILKAWRI